MAIKAHLDQPASQRGAPRRVLRLETSGTLPDGREANVTIHNISAGGLLIETGLELARGETLTLDLPQAGAVEAAVVWRSEGLHGCAFATPLSAGALAAAQLQGLPVSDLPVVAPSPARSGSNEALGAEAEDLTGAVDAGADTAALITECRTRIAEACGTTPAAVRIMIEL